MYEFDTFILSIFNSKKIVVLTKDAKSKRNRAGELKYKSSDHSLNKLQITIVKITYLECFETICFLKIILTIEIQNYSPVDPKQIVQKLVLSCILPINMPKGPI